MRELEITFFGTGTSQGIPMIGCHCAVCTSADPRDRRTRAAIQVRTPEMVIQVDTPPDFRTQCLREGVTRIDAVVYTHSHSDHILGFDDLRRFCEMEDKAMPIHANTRTMRDLQRVFAYAFDPQYHFRAYIRPLPVLMDGPFRLGGTEIVPVDLPHGRMTTAGLVFQRGGRKLLAYFTDCSEVPEAALAAAHGVDTIILDALRHQPHNTHMSVGQAIAAAEAAGARRAFFTHMGHALGHEETERHLPPHIRLAYDGLRLAI
jgi:phosphoribosyl 1,2-cyclic phosphate phosphodiesterase